MQWPPIAATSRASALAPNMPPDPRVTLASRRPCRVSSSVSVFWKARAGGAPFARPIESVAVYRRLYRSTLIGDCAERRGSPSWPTCRRDCLRRGIDGQVHERLPAGEVRGIDLDHDRVALAADLRVPRLGAGGVGLEERGDGAGADAGACHLGLVRREVPFDGHVGEAGAHARHEGVLLQDGQDPCVPLQQEVGIRREEAQGDRRAGARAARPPRPG